MFSGAARCHATEASHIAKQLPSRRWAMTASADVLFHINNVLEDEYDDEYENEPRRVLATSPELIAPAIHQTEDPSVVGPTVGIFLVGRNRSHGGFSQMWRAD
jgi:hypothetical protein